MWMSKQDTAINLVYSEYLSDTLIVRVLDAFGAASDSPLPCLSVNCEIRNTKLNVWCFGDYIHLEEDKQQSSKPCRTPRSYIKLVRERF
jgi:hypothetical protein